MGFDAWGTLVCDFKELLYDISGSGEVDHARHFEQCHQMYENVFEIFNNHQIKKKIIPPTVKSLI